MDLQKKVQTDLAKGKWKNQSRDVDNKGFEAFGFFLDVHVVKEREVRSRMVISEFWLRMIQLFCVDEFESLSPNIMKCNRLCFVIFILIFETKCQHLSEVNEVRVTVRIIFFHFQLFWVITKGKAYLADEG